MASSYIISVKTVRHKSFTNCKQMMNPYSRRMKYGAVLRDPQTDPDVNFTVVMAGAVGEHCQKDQERGREQPSQGTKPKRMEVEEP